MNDPKNTRAFQTSRSRRGPWLATGVLVALMLPPAAIHAQQMIGSGHALDANLRIGSGGYNGGGGGGGGAYRFGPRRGFGVNEGATGERSLGGEHFGVNQGASGESSLAGSRGGGLGEFRRGVYRPHSGGVDNYNAFVNERGYTPLRGAGSDMQHHVQGTGGQVPSARTAAGPARQVPGRRRQAAGFTETYDPGYEASLPDATYDSEAAQKQANALSYGIGFALGEEVVNALKEDKVGVDASSVITGFREALNGEPAHLSDKEIETLLHDLFERVLGDQVEADPTLQTELERNLAAGDAIRARFAANPDVVTLDNGLQYKVLEAGTGAAPGGDDTVRVEYRQLTAEGDYLTELIERQVDLRSTVDGVRLTLTGMNVGEVRRVVIPPHLAHGDSGRPPLYGPGETLFFEVKLLAIE